MALPSLSLIILPSIIDQIKRESLEKIFSFKSLLDKHLRRAGLARRIASPYAAKVYDQ
jgi:hypothetical protein